MVFALPVRQGLFALASLALEFKEEDGQRTHEREIASGDGMTHLAMIFPLGVVSAVMLFGLDGPIPSHQFEKFLRIDFLGPEAGHQIGGFLGGFDHAAFAQELSLAIDPDELSGARQPQGGPIDLQDPESARFDASMSLIQRLSLRGERRPRGVAWLWRARWVDCL